MCCIPSFLVYCVARLRIFTSRLFVGDFSWERPSELTCSDTAELPAIRQSCTGNTTWAAYKDPETGATFWYNHKTQASQWERPEQVAEGQSSRTLETLVEDGHGAAVIDNLNDLGI